MFDEVDVLATSIEESELMELNAMLLGMDVRKSHVWEGPIPPESYTELSPFVRMARPEFMAYRRANELPEREAVMVFCALLSAYDTHITSPYIPKGDVYRRDEPHMTCESMREYLTPVLDTAEGTKAMDVLQKAMAFVAPYRAVCKLTAIDWED